MRYNLLPLIALALPLVISAAVKPQRKREYVPEYDESPKPCRIQSVEDQLRCVVPEGYQVRNGDCPGNDISSLQRSHITLQECVQLCSSSTQCQAFMFSNKHGCFPKTKTCGITSKTNPLHVFYDKVPSRYHMRPGDCPGNDILSLHRKSVTRQACAEFCDSNPTCNAFVLYDNHDCYPKSKGCGIPSLSNNLNIMYDKVPRGYALRPGDCPGNDIWSLHGFISLSECAKRCNSNPMCVSFVYYDGRECFPKARACARTSTENPKNVLFDKVPSGYFMRPGDCSGNDIWSIHDFVSLEECARRCNNTPACISFMFYDDRECYPKTKTCATTSKANPKHFFFDKIKII